METKDIESGQDAQTDWGEATFIMAGESIKVQFFIMRLNYSKARFVMAFSFQKQEVFSKGTFRRFISLAVCPAGSPTTT